MSSVLAERIIQFCTQAKSEKHVIIYHCRRLGELLWGIYQAGENFILCANRCCCPLGAFLLCQTVSQTSTEDEDGATLKPWSEKCIDVHNSLKAQAKSLLGVNDLWIRGFFQANNHGISGFTPVTDDNEGSFQKGWEVGLKVLAWVNSQQEGVVP